jgi:glycosyl transferase family 1/uncharacterized protein DUF3880
MSLPPRVARPRRIVVFGAGGAHRTEAAILRGARALGHTGLLIDVPGISRRLGPWAGRFIRWRVDRFQADTVLLTRYAADLDDRVLGEVVRRRQTAFWFFDLVDGPHERVIRLARAAGNMYLTCPSQIELYRKAGIAEVQFLPQAADPDTDLPAAHAPKQLRCDVSFIGSGQYPYRHELLRAVAGICDLQIRGPGWEGVTALPVAGGPVRAERFSRAVRGAKISLGANAVPQQGNARACTSNRLWKVLGCGGFYLGPRVPDVDRLAQGGLHCAWYDSVEHALELIPRYLADPAARQAIAAAGRAHVLRAHTYAHRVALLLNGRGYHL